MSLVRPVGYVTLACGCRVGRYDDLDTGREIAYVESKGPACSNRRHRRNRAMALESGRRAAAGWQRATRSRLAHTAT